MARYDKTTLDFIEKVSGAKTYGDHSDKKDDEPVKDVLKAARMAIKLQKEPSKTVAKTIIGKATSEILKLAKVPPLGIYGELNDRFKRAWWDWEPETLWRSIEAAGIGKPTDDLKNVVMALQVCVTTNAPFEHWHIFEKAAHAFSQNQVDFGIVQPLELTEAAKAIRILQTLRPKEMFEPEVCSYLATVARSAGLVYLPQELFPAEANSQLEKISYGNPLQKEVAEVWGKKSKSDDPVVMHQIEMLEEIREFVKNG
jgi:hypothetical protein